MNTNLKSIAKYIFKPKSFEYECLKRAEKNIETKLKQTDFFIPINEFNENDIFIVGYPKSGNTWMQSLITGLLYGIDTSFLPDKLAQEVVPDVHARKFYKRFGTINFFKSHHLPQQKYKRVIYIVREGKDAMTSYYFYLKNLGYNISIEEMVYKKKGIFPSLWHEHVRMWIDNPFKSQILYIKYEDLLKSPLTVLKKICEFSGIERSDELLKRVIEGNSFEKMKLKAKIYGGMGHKDWIGDKGIKFFRKGISGDYLNLFSKELINYFNKISEKELKHFNYL